MFQQSFSQRARSRLGSGRISTLLPREQVDAALQLVRVVAVVSEVDRAELLVQDLPRFTADHADEAEPAE